MPEPLAARDRALTVEASAAGETRICSVLRWVDGRIREASARPVHLFRLGNAMARLHDHADGWRPPPDFVRIRWDHETFFADVMVYGSTPARGCWGLLPAEVRVRFESVGARMAVIMADVGGVGLIHADLHLGNALFHRGGVRLIDLDDCGTGSRLYDLAVALWELRDRPGYGALRKALLSGYRTRRDIDVTHLDDVIALRQVAFDLWYTGMAQVNPAFAAGLDRVTAGRSPCSTSSKLAEQRIVRAGRCPSLLPAAMAAGATRPQARMRRSSATSALSRMRRAGR